MKTGTKMLIGGLALFLIGGILLPLGLIATIFGIILGNRPEYTFVVPGQITISVEEPGRYTLWHDYQTVFEGKTYSMSPDLPSGISIRLAKPGTGEGIPLEPGTGTSEMIGSTSRQSIGYFEIIEPGEYVLEVSGGAQERVFSFGKGSLVGMGVLAIFFGGGPVIFLTAIAGLALVIVGAIKLAKQESGAARPSVQAN